MGIDTIKVVFTYGLASVIVIGGFLFMFLTRNDPPTGQSAAMIPLIAGFIGAAIQFVFNRETQTSTARQVERATSAGVASQTTVQS